jgi:hypothetical protein
MGSIARYPRNAVTWEEERPDDHFRLAHLSIHRLLGMRGGTARGTPLRRHEVSMSGREPDRSAIVKATPIEYQASLLGACVLFLGLGVLAEAYLKSFGEILVIVGVITHGWSMYRVRRRNR